MTHRHIVLVRSERVDDWRIVATPACQGAVECDLVQQAADLFFSPVKPRGIVAILKAFLSIAVPSLGDVDAGRPTGYFWCGTSDRGEYEPGKRLTEIEVMLNVPGYWAPHNRENAR